MAKRGQDAPSMPLAKRTKEILDTHGVSHDDFKFVMDGVKRSTLSKDGRQMVTSLLPLSLALPTNERTEDHSLVVSFVKKVLEKSESEIAAVVDTERQRTNQMLASKDDLGVKVTEAESKVVAVEEVHDAKKTALADATRAHSAAQTALADKKRVQSRHECQMELVQQDKTQLAEAITNHLKPLRENNGDLTEHDIKRHQATLVPRLKKCQVVESLVNALPPCFAKKASERSNFELAMLDQLDEVLQGKLVEFESTLANNGATKKEQAAAVVCAESEAEAAFKAQQAAAESFKQVMVEKRQALEKLDAAKGAAGSFDADYAEGTKLLRAKEEELERFKEGTVAAFERLEVREASQEEQDEEAADAEVDEAETEGSLD